jgi:hypothetical protein
MATPREPTSDECSSHARIDVDGDVGYACWYPQMGGYVAKAVAMYDGSAEGGCFDVYVWHDGDFPFSEDHYGIPENPRELHHCSGQQFIAFGEFLVSIENGEDPPPVELHRIQLEASARGSAAGRCYIERPIPGDSRVLEESGPCTLPPGHDGEDHLHPGGWRWRFGKNSGLYAVETGTAAP